MLFKKLIILIAFLFSFSSMTMGPGKTFDSKQTDLPFYLKDSDWVDSVFREMSVDEKLGQLFMAAAYSRNHKSEKGRIENLIKNQQVGGLIFMQGGPQRQAQLTNHFQTLTKTPLLIGMDAEWGLSMRLDSSLKYPRQLLLGALKEENLVQEMGSQIGKQLKALGVHFSFSPVVDVNNNPNNPVINDRSFGEDRVNVSKKGIAYMKGLQSEGILACAKHFPGHGDTDKDSHYDLPTVAHGKKRLDSIELYPFKQLIKAGVSSVMTAHLNVPELDSRKDRPASLSQAIVSDLLLKEMKFRGLVISDALNMKGVSNYFKPGELEVEAFKAGNDILLFSEDIPKAKQALRAALEAGEISYNSLDAKVRKILKAKNWAKAGQGIPIEKTNLKQRLYPSDQSWLIQNIHEKSLVLLRNDKALVPIRNLAKKKIAFVAVGTGSRNPFQDYAESFAPIQKIRIQAEASESQWKSLEGRLKNYDIVVVGIFQANRRKRNYGISKNCFKALSNLDKQGNLILCLFGNPYAFAHLPQTQHSICAHDASTNSQKATTQAIFGAIGMNGRLPVGIKNGYALNSGLESSTLGRLKHSYPEEMGLATADLKRIDAIAQEAINAGASPGCQILVAHKGSIIYNKAFGHFTYAKQDRVNTKTLYDLASITKVAATTISMMVLEERGILDLKAKVQNLFPKSENYAYRKAKIIELLTHRSGLKSWIPFYTYAINSTNKERFFSQTESETFSLRVAENLYMSEAYVDSIWARIGQEEMGPKKYVYSDLGLFISKEIVESLSGQTLDNFCDETFYQPLGLSKIGFQPLEKMKKSVIAPSEKDNYFRNQTLQGDVHDMAAAMFGGVSGHAGLFSNAEDLAILFQMLSNGGSYAGVQYLKPSTVKKWTTKQNKGSRRAIGFDKPDHGAKNGGPTAPGASNATFGHTGFTGTCVWADPVNDVVFVFLSNRTYPSMDNRKLIRMGTRTRIQQVVYDAISASKTN